MTDAPSPRPAALSAWAAWAAWRLGLVFIAVFIAAIWWLGGRLEAIPHAVDQGAGWYYWKLTDPTFTTRASVWSLYAVHQLLGWALIAWAQRSRPTTSTELHTFNVASLALHGVMVALRPVQTHVFYDGLAQDVPVFSALASVAVLLIWVLLMENPRRGLAFGWKAPYPVGVVEFARRFHGYYFAWAIIYTFWFHPTEATRGHLLGFAYLLLIMLQGTLAFTRVHINRWWTTSLEVLVVVHGTMVAIEQPHGLAAMFFFGFSSLFVFTQVNGLGAPRWVQGALVLTWSVGAALTWHHQPMAKWSEPFRIPLIDYLGVVVLTALLWPLASLSRRLRRARS